MDWTGFGSEHRHSLWIESDWVRWVGLDLAKRTHDQLQARLSKHIRANTPDSIETVVLHINQFSSVQSLQ